MLVQQRLHPLSEEACADPCTLHTSGTSSPLKVSISVSPKNWGPSSLAASKTPDALECRASTLPSADSEREVHCLVVFGKGFRSRYTLFVEPQQSIINHDRAFAFVLSFESLEPSPSGDESVIQPTLFYCVYLCFPVSCVLTSATYCATCQPPGGYITT